MGHTQAQGQTRRGQTTRSPARPESWLSAVLSMRSELEWSKCAVTSFAILGRQRTGGRRSGRRNRHPRPLAHCLHESSQLAGCHSAALRHIALCPLSSEPCCCHGVQASQLQVQCGQSWASQALTLASRDFSATRGLTQCHTLAFQGHTATRPWLGSNFNGGRRP